MIITFTYASRALIDPVSPDMLAIVRSSVPHNAALNISGALYFDKTSFFQVLEGRESEVQSLFQKIARDGRHTDVTPLDTWHSPERCPSPEPMRFFDGTRHHHDVPRLDFDRVVNMTAGQRREAALALLRS